MYLTEAAPGLRVADAQDAVLNKDVCLVYRPSVPLQYVYLSKLNLCAAVGFRLTCARKTGHCKTLFEQEQYMSCAGW